MGARRGAWVLCAAGPRRSEEPEPLAWVWGACLLLLLLFLHRNLRLERHGPRGTESGWWPVSRNGARRRRGSDPSHGGCEGRAPTPLLPTHAGPPRWSGSSAARRNACPETPGKDYRDRQARRGREAGGTRHAVPFPPGEIMEVGGGGKERAAASGRKLPVNRKKPKKLKLESKSKESPQNLSPPLPSPAGAGCCPAALPGAALPAGSARGRSGAGGRWGGPEEKGVALTGIEIQALSRVFIVP